MKSIREWASIILAGLSLLGYAWIESTHSDVQNAGRIAALEAHQQEGASKLDHIQTQVDRLVEWAMGAKK